MATVETSDFDLSVAAYLEPGLLGFLMAFAEKFHLLMSDRIC